MRFRLDFIFARVSGGVGRRGDPPSVGKTDLWMGMFGVREVLSAFLANALDDIP